MEMEKTGRNDSCPCGSGKKYKKCCLPQDMARARDQALQQQAERAERAAERHAILSEAMARMSAGAGDNLDELTAASNAAASLVNDGNLDEAERAAHDLLERYPDVHDGWDRLGMVYEARGDKKNAADCYRKVIEFIRAHPGDYEDGFDQVFVELVEKLDPAAH
jgi:tetratricopeptide (TPR) repeat protein